MRVTDNGQGANGVVIDLDGTLYPREFYVAMVLALVRRMFVELQQRPPKEVDELLAELKLSMRTNWPDTSVSRFVFRHGLSPEQWRRYRNDYLRIEPPPASLAVVKSVNQLRVTFGLALLTNNARYATHHVLGSLGLSSEDFDAVVCAEDTDGDPKPHQRGFLLAAARLGVAPSGCWAIGDRFDVDIAPLVALGGAGIEVTGPDELPAAVGYLSGRGAHPWLSADGAPKPKMGD